MSANRHNPTPSHTGPHTSASEALVAHSKVTAIPCENCSCCHCCIQGKILARLPQLSGDGETDECPTGRRDGQQMCVLDAPSPAYTNFLTEFSLILTLEPNAGRYPGPTEMELRVPDGQKKIYSTLDRRIQALCLVTECQPTAVLDGLPRPLFHTSNSDPHTV